MAEIICFGSIALDELLWLPRWPEPGDDLHPLAEKVCLGGSALNVGLPLAAWDHMVAIAGNRIGDDAYGAAILQRLQDYPLDRSALVVESGRRTTSCTLLITPDGERTIIGRAFGEAAVGPLPDLRGARCLSIDPYGPGRREAAQQARAANLIVAAGDLYQPDDLLIADCDLVVLSAAQLARVNPGYSPRSYAAELHRRGVARVALTDGSRPALLLSGGRSYWAQPPILEASETTGAGDSFRAGLIHAVLAGRSDNQALAFAAAAGALRCTVPGGAENPPPQDAVAALAAEIEVWEEEG